MERIVNHYIFDPELTKGKMIFLTGPRQVGKTTFAQKWLESEGSAQGYFNWDDPSVIAAYKSNPLLFKNHVNERFIKDPVPMVFDEIHKHREWRNILKGFFDTSRERSRLLVTGSARLGFARKTGDSLLGRYFSFQMFPLGLPEAVGDFSSVLQNPDIFSSPDLFASRAGAAKRGDTDEAIEQLLRFGGFPEPFLKGSERFHRRWQKDYRTLLTREDVRDLSRISDIKGLETLVEILPYRIGSKLSIPSISRDLDRNYDTIKNWLDILEGLYLIFSLRPWHRRVTRALKKEKKAYFFDWSIPADSGSRFENFVAVSLLRMATRFNETGMGNFELRYLRDKEKREVDFVIANEHGPLALFEAKVGDTAIDRSARYFSRLLNIPLFQIVLKASKVEEFPGNCFVIPASAFLMTSG